MEDTSAFNHNLQDTVLGDREVNQRFLNDIRKILDKKNSNNPELFPKEDLTFSPEDYQFIDQLASKHAQANILNSTTSKEFKEIKDQQKCHCGCGKGFGNPLPILFNQQKISILGSGVILFFFYLRHMRLLLLFSFFLFSSFSIISNISASNFQYDCSYTTNSLSNAICVYNQISTFRQVREEPILKQMEVWLGFCFCIVWIIGVRLIAKLGIKKDKLIDESLHSASDTVLRIQNLPYGQYNEHQLLDYLNQISQEQSYQLEVQSLQIVYNMDDSRKLINDIRQLASVLVSTLENFNSNRITAGKIESYKTTKNLLISKIKRLQQLRNQFQNNGDFRRKNATTLALAEFPSPEHLDGFLKKMDTFQNPLEETLMPSNSVLFKGRRLVIKKAPQPSDFMWLNCEKNVSAFRFIVIWLVVFVVLYIGYAAISFTQTVEFVRKTLGFLSSSLLQFFNRLIWLVLSFLVTYQHNNTKTEAIISLMKKSILAQTINIIVTPMISKFVNGRPLYGDLGVSGMALTYQYVMMVMMLFYYIFNPLHLGKALMLKITCLRNWIIRKNCKKGESNSDQRDLSDVFSSYEGPQFPVAGAYVYMTTATFHGLFYCQLQPIILIFVVINMTLFTLILKYMLYRRCKIPELTHVQVFQFATFLISWGVVFYSVGSIFFFIIDQNINLQKEYSLLFPPILSLFFWFISSLNIYGIFNAIDSKILKMIKIAHGQTRIKNKNEYRGTIHIDRFAEQLSNTEDINVWSRKESYYKNCNTNILLDFEMQLLEYSNNYPRKGNTLKKFCQGFNTVETFDFNLPSMKEPQLMKNNSSILENSTNFFKLKTIYQNNKKFDFIPVILIEKDMIKSAQNP